MRFDVPIAVLVGFAEVIAQLADGLPHRYFAILIRPFDIPQRDHLFQRLRAPPLDPAAYTADGVHPRPELLPSSE